MGYGIYMETTTTPLLTLIKLRHAVAEAATLADAYDLRLDAQDAYEAGVLEACQAFHAAAAFRLLDVAVDRFASSFAATEARLSGIGA